MAMGSKSFIATIQARMGSTRLPGKSLMAVEGKPLLQYVVERVAASSCQEIIICTSDTREDDSIASFCKNMSISCFRGDKDDVLGRIFAAIRHCPNCHAVRITGDSPLVDPAIIDYLISIHIKNNNAVTTNYFSKSFPSGTILSIISYEALNYLHNNVHERETREHIVFGFDALPAHLRYEIVTAPPKWRRNDIRLDVDYENDLKFLSELVGRLGFNGNSPNTCEIIEYLDQHPELEKNTAKVKAPKLY